MYYPIRWCFRQAGWQAGKLAGMQRAGGRADKQAGREVDVLEGWTGKHFGWVGGMDRWVVPGLVGWMERERGRRGGR